MRGGYMLTTKRGWQIQKENTNTIVKRPQIDQTTRERLTEPVAARTWKWKWSRPCQSWWSWWRSWGWLWWSSWRWWWWWIWFIDQVWNSLQLGTQIFRCQWCSRQSPEFVCVFQFLCISICVFVFVFVYLCLCNCNCVFVCVYLYLCICICVFVFVYLCI